MKSAKSSELTTARFIKVPVVNLLLCSNSNRHFNYELSKCGQLETK